MTYISIKRQQKNSYKTSYSDHKFTIHNRKNIHKGRWTGEKAIIIAETCMRKKIVRNQVFLQRHISNIKKVAPKNDIFNENHLKGNSITSRLKIYLNEKREKT